MLCSSNTCSNVFSKVSSVMQPRSAGTNFYCHLASCLASLQLLGHASALLWTMCILGVLLHVVITTVVNDPATRAWWAVCIAAGTASLARQ
jgi:hypothetical protein